MKIRPVGAELFPADGQTDVKLIIERAYNMSTFYIYIYIYMTASVV